MTVDKDAKPVAPPDAKPSAEVLLHRAVYRCYPSAQTVLHTHSVSCVVLSKLEEGNRGLLFHGFEMQKAFEGVQSHEEKVWLPIFPNSQDMATLSSEVEAYLLNYRAALDKPRLAPGFILAGHGLYAWGDTPAQAKRHIEAFEYLFSCLLALRTHGYTHPS